MAVGAPKSKSRRASAPFHITFMDAAVSLLVCVLVLFHSRRGNQEPAGVESV